MIPADWTAVQLADVAKCEGGSAFSPSLQGRKQGEIPFLKVSDMNLPDNTWFMSTANNYVDFLDAASITGKVKPKGSVIFPKVGAALHTNKKRLLTASAYVDNNVMAVWTTDPNRCSPAYLYLYFLTVNLSDLANPGPLPSINSGKVYEQQICLPPRKEQDKIAAVLWKLQTSINIQDKLVRTTRELRLAAMRRLFTHGVRGELLKQTDNGLMPNSWGLDSLAHHCNKPEYGLTASAVAEAVGPHFLRITDITDSGVDWTIVPYCKCSDEEYAAKHLEHNDIVFARIGATTGKSFIVKNPPLSVFASYLIRVRPKVALDPDFLYYYFNTEAYWRHIDANKDNNMKGGVNASILSQLQVPVPTLDEQKEIAAMLLTLDRKIGLHDKKRTALQDLFQTLLHQLMTGRIRVNDLGIDTSEVAI